MCRFPYIKRGSYDMREQAKCALGRTSAEKIIEVANINEWMYVPKRTLVLSYKWSFLGQIMTDSLKIELVQRKKLIQP